MAARSRAAVLSLWRSADLKRKTIQIPNKFYSTSVDTSPSAVELRPLDGKIAVITGAASGIGEAAARLFVSKGAKVILADVQDDAGKILAEELGGLSTALYQHCDVTQEQDVEATINAAVHVFGSLDIVLSNAGIVGAIGSLESMNMEEVNETLAVNILGTVHCLKHSARVLKPLRKGSIVITSSSAGVVGGHGPHAYSLAKAGLVGLARSAASELRSFNIRVNCVSPFVCISPIIQQTLGSIIHGDPSSPFSADDTERIYLGGGGLLKPPMPGRLLHPPEVAQAILWLSSEHASYITGHNLLIDGGETSGRSVEGNPWFDKPGIMLRRTDKTVSANAPPTAVPLL